MANGTPSNSIPLGSALLSAMGDIKGAAKALGDEAKEAKRGARDANKDLKSAQRELNKTNREIERVQKRGGTVSEAQKMEQKRLEELVESRTAAAEKRTIDAANASIKAETAKQEIKAQRDADKQEAFRLKDMKERDALSREFDKLGLSRREFDEMRTGDLRDRLAQERERIKGLNIFERRVNDRLLGVRDTLQGVGRSLQGTKIPQLQALGRRVEASSGFVTSENLATASRLGGLALRGAGIGAAGVAGGIALSGFAQRAVRANIESNQIRGEIADQTRRAFKEFAGREIDTDFLRSLGSRLDAQEAAAKEQATRESTAARFVEDTFLGRSQAAFIDLVGSALGSSPNLTRNILGTQQETLRREKQLKADVLEDVRIEERFGRQVAERVSLDTLRKSRGVRDALKRQIDEDRNRTLVTSWLNANTLGLFDDAIEDIIYGAQDERNLDARIREQRQKEIQRINESIEEDKRNLRADAIGASLRKQNAIRDQRLEEERIRRNMQTARF